MAFNPDFFREIDSRNNSRRGGQSYAVYSLEDSIDEMLEPGYLNPRAETLNARDNVLVGGVDGAVVAQVKSSQGGEVVLSTTLYYGPREVIDTPGVANPDFAVTEINGLGSDTVTMADGSIGSTKVVTMIQDNGNVDLVPDTPAGYTRIRFADVGDTVSLLYTSIGWAILGKGGRGNGPNVTP